jgi:hypothetical protein
MSRTFSSFSIKTDDEGQASAKSSTTQHTDAVSPSSSVCMEDEEDEQMLAVLMLFESGGSK